MRIAPLGRHAERRRTVVVVGAVVGGVQVAIGVEHQVEGVPEPRREDLDVHAAHHVDLLAVDLVSHKGPGDGVLVLDHPVEVRTRRADLQERLMKYPSFFSRAFLFNREEDVKRCFVLFRCIPFHVVSQNVTKLVLAPRILLHRK